MISCSAARGTFGKPSPVDRVTEAVAGMVRQIPVGGADRLRFRLHDAGEQRAQRVAAREDPVQAALQILLGPGEWIFHLPPRFEMQVAVPDFAAELRGRERAVLHDADHAASAAVLQASRGGFQTGGRADRVDDQIELPLARIEILRRDGAADSAPGREFPSPGRRIDAGRVASEKLRGLGGEVADRTEPDHRDAFRQRFPAAEGVQPDVDEPQETGEFRRQPVRQRQQQRAGTGGVQIAVSGRALRHRREDETVLSVRGVSGPDVAGLHRPAFPDGKELGSGADRAEVGEEHAAALRRNVFFGGE